MTLDEKIAQLLHPAVDPCADGDSHIEAFGGLQPGGIFLWPGKSQQFRDTTERFRRQFAVPAIISSDLTNGAGWMIHDATVFPFTMAIAAADSEELAYEVGRAGAVEGRSCGVHWTFAPAMDINVNPHNPIGNCQTFGDDVQRVSRLGAAMIRGLQENGVAAGAKHFPGDGFDDRDQHCCTAINPLSMDQWFALSGRAFKAAVDAGVWSVMTAHVSLPACDSGDGTHPSDAPPGSLSRKLTTGLLREQLGFGGVVISDAMMMGGVTSWMGPEEAIVTALEAGCDMILYSQLKRDFDILTRAVETGRLSESRIDESVRRILALKEALGLNEDAPPPEVSQDQRECFQQASKTIADKAITLVQDRNGVLPLELGEGKRVLSYHVRGFDFYNVDEFDEMLRQRGVEVTRYTEKDSHKPPTGADLLAYDAVIVNMVFVPSYGTNRIRPAGDYFRNVWELAGEHHPRMVVVSYGSPYHLYDLPKIPALVNAYCPTQATQQAVLKVLTGQMQATGTSPVDLDSPYRFKAFDHLMGE